MRFKSKHPRAFKDDEKVAFHHFLLFPKRINGEWRWLEMGNYEAKAWHSYTGMRDEWREKRWLD